MSRTRVEQGVELKPEAPAKFVRSAASLALQASRSTWIIRMSGSGSLGKESTRDRQSLTAYFDNVFRKKLSASASFQHAVHFDFAVLDHELGMSPGSRNGTQFQELIQTEFSGFRLGVRHRRVLLSVQGWSAGSWLSCGPNCGSTQSLICSHHSAPIILSKKAAWQNDGGRMLG